MPCFLIPGHIFVFSRSWRIDLSRDDAVSYSARNSVTMEPWLLPSHIRIRSTWKQRCFHRTDIAAKYAKKRLQRSNAKLVDIWYVLSEF